MFSNKKFDAIEFKQENIKMYILKMNIDKLIEASMITHYNSEKNKDYQRAPIPSHYRKIYAYFMKEKNPILPSAVLAAIGSDKYNYKNGEIEFNDKIRIVDGQHRIEGLKCLRDGYCNGSKERYQDLINRFEIPVIVMIIDDEYKLIEIDAFINLNSKGKRVRTDLAQALKLQKYQKSIENKDVIPVDEELFSNVSTEVAIEMNREKGGFWEGKIIQADELGNRSNQPISVIAFSRAITPLVKKYCFNKGENVKKSDLSEIRSNIQEIINDVWNCIVKKWPGCFIKGKYDADYNICKGIGVTTLLLVFAETDYIKNGHTEFVNILKKTRVTEEDWLVGGTFTGYASYQGFKKITKYIKGEINDLS